MKILRYVIGAAMIGYFGVKLIYDGGTLYRDMHTVSRSQ